MSAKRDARQKKQRREERQREQHWMDTCAIVDISSRSTEISGSFPSV